MNISIIQTLFNNLATDTDLIVKWAPASPGFPEAFFKLYTRDNLSLLESDIFNRPGVIWKNGTIISDDIVRSLLFGEPGYIRIDHPDSFNILKNAIKDCLKNVDDC